MTSLVVIQLENEKGDSLGFNVGVKKDGRHIITLVEPESVASQKLFCEDELFEINGSPVTLLTHASVIDLIKLNRKQITLVVKRARYSQKKISVQAWGEESASTGTSPIANPGGTNNSLLSIKKKVATREGEIITPICPPSRRSTAPRSLPVPPSNDTSASVRAPVRSSMEQGPPPPNTHVTHTRIYRYRYRYIDI